MTGRITATKMNMDMIGGLLEGFRPLVHRERPRLFILL